MTTNAIPSCDNCSIYGWKQPDDRSTIKRCSRCEVVSYCSKQCQKEHWYNAHKQHCKYLVPSKVLPNAKHNEATCLVCKEESRAGSANMSQSNNKVLPCYMSVVNKIFMNIPKVFLPNGVPLSEEMPALPLAEMTGIYHSKLDTTFAIMMRILVKMKMTKHIIWSTRKSSVEKLYRILLNCRVDEWWGQLNTKPGSSEHNGAPYEEDASANVLTAIKDIDSVFLTVPELRMFIPWGTFKILFMFSFDFKYMEGCQIADYLGTSDMPEEVANIRMTYSEFHMLWEKLLNRLKEGLVPLTTLVEVLCEGNVLKRCLECGIQVHVKDVAVLHGANGHVPGLPVFMLGAGLAFSLCGKPDCFQSLNVDTFRTARRQMLLIYERLMWEYGREECDYCGGINQEVKSHRCAGCKTKVYCKVECLNSDKVHLRLCQEEERRKMKPSNTSRREKGRVALEKRYSNLSL